MARQPLNPCRRRLVLHLGLQHEPLVDQKMIGGMAGEKRFKRRFALRRLDLHKSAQRADFRRHAVWICEFRLRQGNSPAAIAKQDHLQGRVTQSPPRRAGGIGCIGAGLRCRSPDAVQRRVEPGAQRHPYPIAGGEDRIGIDILGQGRRDVRLRRQAEHERLEGIVDCRIGQQPFQGRGIAFHLFARYAPTHAGEDQFASAHLARLPAVEAVAVVAHEEELVGGGTVERQIDRRREAAIERYHGL